MLEQPRSRRNTIAESWLAHQSSKKQSWSLLLSDTGSL